MEPTTPGRSKAREMRLSRDVLEQVSAHEALGSALHRAVQSVRHQYSEVFSGNRLLKYGYLWDAFVLAAQKEGVMLGSKPGRGAHS